MTGKNSPFGVKSGGEARRRAMLASSSLAALATLVGALPAHADSTIGSARTTPVATSTAGPGGTPDNVVINGDGSVKPASGVAVTADSDNTVTNGGTIQIQNQSDAAGILILGGHTGGVTNSGTITLNQTAQPTDTNGDGNIDGPFAIGARLSGISATGPDPYTGTITNAGAITVQGDDSAGISIETQLQGALSSSNAITVTGSRSVGIRTLGVAGDVALGGSVAAQGEGAQGVAIGGDVGGQVLIQGAVTSTGYRYPTLSTDPTFTAKLGADDLLQGGPAISVAGSVAKGILIDTTGSAVSSGQAPGLAIGAVGREITLGAVGTDVDAFGLEVRGVVSGLGVYNGATATGLQIGVDGGGQVFTGAGVHVTGSVTASAAEASATAMVLNAGANVPLLQNDGTISALATATGPASAHGLLIGLGASVPGFANSATLSAAATSSSGDAVALQDLSGTLTSIQNIRTISATVTPPAGGTTSGRAIAIDVSANTSGVNLLQYDTSAGLTPPAIIGAVLFGSGSDRADIQAGTVTGDMSFGGGANRLSISGGAKVTGALTAQGGTLALAIADGALTMTNTDHINLTSLSLGGGSSLTFTIDPEAGTSTSLQVAGAANIAGGAKFGLRFTSLLQGSATYTLIQASQLSAGTIDTSLLGAIPYLYKVHLGADAAQGAITAEVARKTAAELGLGPAATAAYDPTVAAIDRQAPLRDAILAQTDQAGFTAASNQLLPNRSSAVFELATAQADAVGRALDDRQTAGGGAWIQELNFGANDKGRDGLPGYNAYGVGVAGGYERALAPLAIFGLDVGISSSEVHDQASGDTSKINAESFGGGVYWRGVLGRFTANARVGAGYVKLSSDRAIAISSGTSTLFGATASSNGSGQEFSGRFHLAYDADFGALYLRPQVSVDYLKLSEDGYTETGGGAGVDLAVASRSSSQSSAFAGLAIGKTFGEGDASWGPELLVGYRDVVSEKLAETTARFVSGGDSFTIPAEAIGGQGAVARVAFKGENGYGGFALEAGGEERDGLTIYDVRIAAHVAF